MLLLEQIGYKTTTKDWLQPTRFLLWRYS